MMTSVQAVLAQWQLDSAAMRERLDRLHLSPVITHLLIPTENDIWRTRELKAGSDREMDFLSRHYSAKAADFLPVATNGLLLGQRKSAVGVGEQLLSPDALIAHTAHYSEAAFA